ncbi:MAG: DUF92 domain-containing protein [Candidatus Ranarchaeia archaeon]|jgi:uncharacterized protein (TIGR00297 family)
MMVFNPCNFVVGVVASCFIGILGVKLRYLKIEAALVAIPIGIFHTGWGGISYMLMLFTFFVSSSIVSKYKTTAKQEVQDQFEKGSTRDIGQVLANAGIPTIAIFLDNFVLANPIWFIVALANYAAKNSDTWATELGTLSTGKTYQITSLKEVPRGTAGGVSVIGTLASVIGALVLSFSVFCVRIVALVLGGSDILLSVILAVWILFIGTASGFVGSFLDSFIAATLQKMYICPTCQVETEKPIHKCGQTTDYLRGWKFLTNDWVNLLSLLGAAGFGITAKLILDLIF